MNIICIKNVNVIETSSPFTVKDGVDVVITDNKITAVGVGVSKNVVADVMIDGKGKYLSPGFVCSHHHYYSLMSRGMLVESGPQDDFIRVLKEWWWKLDRALDEESMYYSSLICSIEALLAGTTSVIDHHESPNYINGSLSTIAKGFEEIGIRGITCYGITERNYGLKEAEKGVEENIRFANECDEKQKILGDKNLVQAMIGGHAPFTVSNDALKLLSSAVRETKHGLCMHVAEGEYDVLISHDKYNKDIIDRLLDFNLIDDKTLLVHGTFLKKREADMINRLGAYLAHNPRSNMNNCVGYCKVMDDVNNIVLGTDGWGANMFDEMKIGFFKNKESGGTWWPANYLNALTRGNELLEKYYEGKFGKVEEGYVADLVLLDYNAPTPFVSANLGAHLVWNMTSGNVDTVIVGGQIKVQNHKLVGIDTEEIYKRAREVAFKKVWPKF